MINGNTLRAIIQSKDTDLKSLAEAAGGDPSTFFRGANFNDSDLRGEDLRGFNLKAATFRRVRVDKNTLVDAAFEAKVGTGPRVPVYLPVFNLLQSALISSGTKIEKPIKVAYGDVLEDAIFGSISKEYMNKLTGISIKFDQRMFQTLMQEQVLNMANSKQRMNIRVARSRDHTYELALKSDAVNTALAKFVSGNLTIEPHRSNIGQEALLTKRTSDTARKLSKLGHLNISEWCCAVLILYAAAHKDRM